MTQGSDVSNKMSQKNKVGREAIHSGHFMVSDFEAEAQDDEDELAVPVPEEEALKMSVVSSSSSGVIQVRSAVAQVEKSGQHLTIETSLTKLFQCMSLAYRQKLTSPKWNRFKGIRLRWKDKIRLNNVIWRCWHMQFIMKQNTLVCQFASPLDVDTHNKPEAVVLEGKYWKRKLATVTAEYKKWRMFYKNKIMGWTGKELPDVLSEMDVFDWQPHSNDSVHSINSVMVDEDYMDFMSDTLFSTITSNQPYAFPNQREIARGAGLADFIQPSLVQLQPNLDDFMDTLEPLQELLYSKLPPVPEESTTEDIIFRNTTMPQSDPTMMDEFVDLDVLGIAPTPNTNQTQQTQQQQQSQLHQQQQLEGEGRPRQYPTSTTNSETISGFGEISVVDGNENFATNCIPQQPSVFIEPTCTNANAVQYRPVGPQTHQRVPGGRSESPARDVLKMKTVRRSGVVGNAGVSATNNFPGYRQATTSYSGEMISGVGNVVESSSSISSIPRTDLTVSNVGLHSEAMVTQQIGLNVPEVVDSVIRPTQGENSSNMKNLTRRSSTPGDKEEVFAVPKSSARRLVRSSSSTPLATKSFGECMRQLGKMRSEYHGKPRGRWRSGSSLNNTSSPGTSQSSPPPLVSVGSEPSIHSINPSALLTHLLTNRTFNDKVPLPNSMRPVQPGPSPTTQQPVTMSTQSPITSTTNPVPILPMPIHRPPTHTRLGPPTTTVLITTQIPMATGIEAPSTSTVNRNETLPVPRQVASPMMTESPDSPPGEMGRRGSGFSSPAQSPSPGRQAEGGGSSGGPLSPPRPFRPKTDTERVHYKEHRRVCHINAEQKRRCNIKNGFDMLHSLIPQLNQNPNSKLSKAAMLQKGAEYIRQLRAEREQLKEDMASLRQEIEGLNAAISNCQSMLPATGAPVSRQRAGKMRERFDEFVRIRTLQNWKFWIFSILFEPLLISFNSTVSTASLEDLCRTTLLWVEQHCSLVDLRPAVLNSLRYLCTATDILSDPSRLPEEATRAVTSGDGKNAPSKAPPRPPPVQ